MEIARPGTELFVITEKGYGKRTPMSEYPTHHRGGQGVFTITMTQKKGLLTGMKVVEPGDELMIISEEGVVIRTPVEDISQLGRSTQGVHVMNVAEGDKVCAVAISTESSKDKADKSIDEGETLVAEADSDQDELVDVPVDEFEDEEVDEFADDERDE